MLSRNHRQGTLVAGLVVLVLTSPAAAGLEELAKCQKGIAKEGARFAQRTITATLKCTQAIADCQIQCQLGVFGPTCDASPPPCCDPDDRNSIAGYTTCMNQADALCAAQTAKIDLYEIKKQDGIAKACIPVTTEELCGTTAVGLNFDTLNAGCLAINPTYECNLTNLIACVGGPLERQLIDQISGLLHPRAADAVKVSGLNLQSTFPDLPVTQKVFGQVAAGRMDVWQITGQADQDILVKVQTRDDGGGVSSLAPALIFLENDTMTAISDTSVRDVECAVPSVCGGSCKQFKRSLTHSGTFHVAVGGSPAPGCPGGQYRLVVTSPGGAVPLQVMNDVNALGIVPGFP